jgi:hypothetical protein
MDAKLFLSEFKKLIDKKPKNPTKVYNSTNIESCNHIFFSENLYECFDSSNCNNSAYLENCFMAVKSFDCDYAIEAELCYECVDPFKCFNCTYIENCAHMQDSDYCTLCINCNYCFGCSRLKHKSYCLFNRQLTKEEYEKEVKKYKKWSSEEIIATVKEIESKFPWTETNDLNNTNSNYGNYFYNNKNCYLLFDSSFNQNSAYLYDSNYNVTCLDSIYEFKSELAYESLYGSENFNCNYIYSSAKCQDSSYIFECLDVKNCLGCVGLSHRKYCLLNRQLEEKEYEKVSSLILKDFQRQNLGWHNI